MLSSRFSSVLIATLFASTTAIAADPTDNPVASFYSGPEGYPAWTDGINWSNVINMKTYPKGKNAYEKFQAADKEVHGRGGVLYYPAGTYDFSSMPPGVGLMLGKGTVIRGEAPSGKPHSSDGKLELATKFIFPFNNRAGGKVPGDWNFIGLQRDDAKVIKNTHQVGIAWLHVVGATVAFGPQLDWAKTWGTASGLMSDRVKKAWKARDPSGTHPFDALAGGGKIYVGAGHERLVFGCVFEDSAVLDDFYDPGYGNNGFQPSMNCARIIAYGSRVFVANNLLPRSRKNFRYRQPNSIGKGNTTAVFDYGRTGGIDINKDLLLPAAAKGECSGYFEEGVVVRDNFVFNHGHKGFSVSGNWVSITGNRNERLFLKSGDDVYGLGPSSVLTSDGYDVSTAQSDNKSRAFELAGRNVWIDGNRFNNTGSSPGMDGEGIICRDSEGTSIRSWAITHNIHTRGIGAAGAMGGSNVDCRGLLIGWNTTPGWVGNAADAGTIKMTNCAFIANKSGKILPDAKTIKSLEITPPLIAAKSESLAPPGKVTATIYHRDAVEVNWTDASKDAIGFRVERRIGDGKWFTIAYRPPQMQSDPDNPPKWIDFTAPTEKPLSYRVIALNPDDSDAASSMPSEAVTLTK